MSKTFTPSKKLKINPATAEDLTADESMFEPRQHVIQNILNYSKALSVQKSENVGHIEIVRN